MNLVEAVCRFSNATLNACRGAGTEHHGLAHMIRLTAADIDADPGFSRLVQQAPAAESCSPTEPLIGENTLNLHSSQDCLIPGSHSEANKTIR